ncbi:serine/threonine-protein kinase [Nocardioides coralli]|uniref:serine/threonine-protein kinase n=1 Tax=Nocardioides coralli TaxID=2872154 RepID=UPI001CA40B58|nr:serine/threonine-protein kinase [Nocardioides coralli]QZY30466.1 serine/threonine protein kinase [Nocardioides coralli]
MSDESFGPYQVLDRVAEGSTSTVFRARHRELERTAAIKMLHPAVLDTPGMRERLRAEAETLAGLEDDHIVQVYDYVEESDRAWIAEEWVAGASLEQILEAHRTLTPEQSVGVVRGALLGLAHAHDRGVLHRDVSPGNVLADTEGVSKLVDFGLAAPIGSSGVSGTPAFLSPEAARGESLDKPSDVYSSAAVLYTLLAGVPPFAGSDVATTIRRHLEEPAPLLEGHGHDLQDLLRRSLAKDPSERPRDARAFLEELEEAARRRFGATWLQRASIASLVGAAVPAAGGGGAAAPTVVVDAARVVGSPVAETVKRGTRRLVAIGAGAVLVVVGGTAATIALTGDDGDAPEAVAPVAAGESAAAEEEEPPTLEELTPSGRFAFTRTRVASTYDPPGQKQETTRWALDVRRCQGEEVCSGSIKSSSGSTFKYTWNGKRLDVTPPKNGRDVYEGLCVDTVTGEESPGTWGRATTVVTWLPLRTVKVDESGFPVRLTGTQKWRTTYEGLTDCDDSPADTATYRIVLVRR